MFHMQACGIHGEVVKTPVMSASTGVDASPILNRLQQAPAQLLCQVGS